MSMEGFSAAQIAHAHGVSLDLFTRGPLHQIGIAKKPLLRKMEAAKKSFPGAKEFISEGVKLERGANGVNDTMQGFSHDEAVGFYNPAGGRRATFVWREHHLGITLSETLLKQQGILVGDEFGNIKKSAATIVTLANIMDDANLDWMEQVNASLNAMFWGDGTADPSGMAGLQSIIATVPTVGTVGNISRATNPKWRNRSRTAAFFASGSFDAAWGGDRVTASPANGGALLQELEEEWLQLTAFGGDPDTFLAGSSFVSAMQTEHRANGSYSQVGFKNKQDGGMGQMMFKGVPVEYDPTLDSMGMAKFAYIFDSSHIRLRHLEGDWRRKRDPARPFNQFVLHKSMICTGQITAKQLDSALVIEIA